MRRRLLFVLPIALLLAGCGGKFQLPSEVRGKAPIPPNGQYTMLQTWDNMDGIQDILLTQGKYSQLFLLFNHGGVGGPDDARGEVRLFPFANPVAVDESYFPRPKTLFNPVALCAGVGRLYVLDQGDSCMAKFDVQRGTCEADPTPITSTTFPRPPIVWDYRSAWRVREYVYNDASGGRYTGDTATTFTDTSMVQVFGIAADPQGRVYVSGVVASFDTALTGVNPFTRTFKFRIFRYAHGTKPGYGGLVPEELNWDKNLVGAGGRWYRDTTWFVASGTGTGFVIDPRGMTWSPAGNPALLVADKGNSQVKTLSPNAISTGLLRFDGSDIPPLFTQFQSPEAVAADLQGYLYAVDRGAARVVRYDPFGAYAQTVNAELNSHGQPLLDPVTVGVDDSVAYVGDRGRGQVIRYKRRQ